MRIAIFLTLVIFSVLANIALANTEHYFSTIKNNPDSLYAFFLEMPKGGELHYHLTGGALPEVMLSLVPRGNYCLNTQNYTLKISKNTCHDTPLNTLQKNSALYDSILRAWSMKGFKPNHKESGHDHFFATFYKFSPIASRYAPELLADVMRRAARQHELYLEVMTLPDQGRSAHFNSLINKTSSLADKKKILLANTAFQNNIKKTVSESAQLLKKTQQLLNCDAPNPTAACHLTVKLQYIVLREQPLDSLFAQALNGFEAAKQSPDLVAVNLVQAEDGPISLHDYRRQMKIFNFLHQAYPNVHISLHAGELTPETLKSKSSRTRELRYHIHDALLTGHAERIGHGVDITYEDNASKLLDYMSKNKTPVEISLTSNRKILNVSGKAHPIHQYLKHNVPIVLSTDDEGILRTNLTHEYVNAVIQHNLDYATIKTINRNALTYSFLSGKSLWRDPDHHILVDQCEILHSVQCYNYIVHNEKATLQWALEIELLNFERKYQAK